MENGTESLKNCESGLQLSERKFSTWGGAREFVGRNVSKDVRRMSIEYVSWRLRI